MYYYIFDLKKCGKRSTVTEIKNHLAFLGISGEYTYPSPAYTVEELVELGLSKKYNTIVGIGDDEIANKIAGKLCGRSEAMGMIPIEASVELCQILKARNWKEAADNLRFRKIEEFRVGRLANGSAFLTSIELDLKGPTEVTMEFKDFLVQAKLRNLAISNICADVKKISPEFLDIIFESVDPKENGLLDRISNLIGLSKDKGGEFSMIRARSLRIFTSSQIGLVTPAGSIAKTPQFVESSDDFLRLIVGKKISR